MYTIGIDIGGTNTDAVLVDSHQKIVHAVKHPTSQSIDQGFYAALAKLLKESCVSSCDIRAIFLGTTHATNALLQRSDLYPVGLIRIGGHRPELLPPCFDWPEDLKSSILVGWEGIGGGNDCSGSEITSFNPHEMALAVEKLMKKGAESFAVVGQFSPLYPQHEQKVREYLEKTLHSNLVSLSSEIGSMGIIERENATLLNAALKKPLEKGFLSLESVLQDLEINAPFFVTQNNGTIMTIKDAIRFPVLTIGAGPTNSLIGGAKLAGYQDCIVVDIGGTSTDVGMVKNGFPRRSLDCTNIGGVSLNFPMPDILSIALGGGSYIYTSPMAIGPKSAAKNIVNEARVFGGSSCTLLDAAASVFFDIVPNAIRPFVPNAQEVLELAKKKIELLVEKMAGKETHLPVVVVGGGAVLLKNLLNKDRYIVPDHAEVANALGAAFTEIAATMDQTVSLMNREKVIEEAIEKSKNATIARGADPKTVRLIDLQILPYHYVPGNMARIIVMTAGSKMD